ncbi:MAG: autotransporter-associated beta strand repeat-containing protein [Verrucomicrobiota bacterium]
MSSNFPNGYTLIVYVGGTLANTNAWISDGEATNYYRSYYTAGSIPSPLTLTQITNTSSATNQLGQYAVFGYPTLLTSNSITISLREVVGSGALLGGFQIVGQTTYDLLGRVWVGSLNSDWNNSSLNWTNNTYGTTNYVNGFPVYFTDLAASSNRTVNLTTDWQPSSVTVFSTTNYTFTGSGIKGSGGFIQMGSGMTKLNNANTYTGDTTISAGKLQLGNVAAIPSGASAGNVSVASIATLDLNGFSTSINGLSGTGTVTNSGAAAILSMGLNNYSTNFSGAIMGAVSLVKTGTGTQSIAGTDTYTGTTTVNAGILSIAADMLQVTNSFIVNNGGTLNGTNAIGGSLTINSGGTFYAGSATNSIGTFTINGNVSLAGTTIVTINKDVSPSNDVVNVAGSLSYGGTLKVYNFGTNALAAGDAFQIFPAGGTGSFSSITGDPGVTYSFSNGVLSVVSINSPTLSYTTLGGGVLQFNWPGASKLQWQTNSLGTNWVNFPGGGTSPVNVSNNPTIPAAFFRLSQ